MNIYSNEHESLNGYLKEELQGREKLCIKKTYSSFVNSRTLCFHALGYMLTEIASLEYNVYIESSTPFIKSIHLSILHLQRLLSI